jgi:hypothetical protein
MFIWPEYENYLLDGHQRIKALIELRQEGYDIPPLPVDYIDAKTETEAREKLLHITSQYGDFYKDGLDSWLNDFDKSIKETIRLVNDEIEILDLSLIENIESKIEEKNLTPFKRVHVLLSMSQDTFFLVQEYIKQIKNAEGVEYEQSQN